MYILARKRALGAGTIGCPDSDYSDLPARDPGPGDDGDGDGRELR